MVDFLVIRSRVQCDNGASEVCYQLGEGLADFIRSKGFTAMDLSDDAATPEKVQHYMSPDNGDSVTRAVIAFDHGNVDVFWGEDENNAMAPVIHMNNVAKLTNKLHVYTCACYTSAPGGLGEKAVSSGGYSWLGYTDPAWVTDDVNFRECIWSYVEAMVEGKTIEECEQVLRKAYKDRKHLAGIYQENLDLMKLHKKTNGMTVKTHSRITDPIIPPPNGKDGPPPPPIQAESRIWDVSFKASVSTNANAYCDIPGFKSLRVSLADAAKVIITLTVMDTWNDTEKGARTWFGIDVNTDTVAEGSYTSPEVGARVPITVSTVIKLEKGDNYIEAKWKVTGGKACIGLEGGALLTVVAGRESGLK